MQPQTHIAASKRTGGPIPAPLIDTAELKSGVVATPKTIIDSGLQPAKYASGNSSQARPRSVKAELISYLVVSLTLFAGWQLRNEQYLTAEHGLGYYLGIVGGAMMLILFLYPLRKKWRPIRTWGHIKHWFLAHIIFGVIGPVLVLFHANFQLGSLNSKVATISMLAVVISGFVGKYFYKRIHHQTSGDRATIQSLMDEATNTRRSARVIGFVPRLDEQLLQYEQAVLTPARGVLHSAIRPILLSIRTRWAIFRLNRFITRDLNRSAKTSSIIARHQTRLYKVAKNHIAERLSKVRKVAHFSFYEKLFSFWHLFHYPLLLVLLVATTIHILAVHMY